VIHFECLSDIRPLQTMQTHKNINISIVAIFWDTAPCSPYVNWRFGGTYNLHFQGREATEQETSLQQAAGQDEQSPGMSVI
jgi:hypothetical protein